MEIKIVSGLGELTIELPIADSELTFEMKRNGITDVIPRCKLLEVSEDGKLLSQCVGDWINLDEVNFFVKRLENFTEYERQVLDAFAIHKGISDVKELINLTYSMQGLSVVAELSDTKEVGKRLYMDKHKGMPVDTQGNIDFVEYADKVFREQKVNAFPNGLLIENGFELKAVYNGKTFPKYIYDTESVVAVVEISNAEGEKDYLYLPTEVNQWEKLKARLRIQKFDECRITDIENLKLPQKFMVSKEPMLTLKELTLFNEMCFAVQRFNKVEMEALEIAMDFIGSSTDMIITAVAGALDKFEIIPNIHSDFEYGVYIVKESGEYDIPKELLPYIQYGTFAMNRRKEKFHASDYVEKGFVGSREDLSDYLEYKGEFADLLEFNENDYELFCLYSPLTAVFNYDDFPEGTLYADELVPYLKEIENALKKEEITSESARGFMKYYSEDISIAGKIVSAFPKVVQIQDELYGVLECRINKPLTKAEVQALKYYWTNQMSEGWGNDFEQYDIEVEDGTICVSFWTSDSDSDWFLKTAEEMGITQKQGLSLSI